MTEAFRVDPESLAGAVARMTEFGRHAEHMLGEIDSLVTDLNAMWTGEGAAAHAEAHRRWVQGEAMMREALSRLRAAGATAHRNYTDVVRTNVAIWS
jgi:WXG100 family type VII secretion target